MGQGKFERRRVISNYSCAFFSVHDVPDVSAEADLIGLGTQEVR